MKKSSMQYCDGTLLRRYWTNHPSLGIGRVCNRPIPQGGECPNRAQHATQQDGMK